MVLGLNIKAVGLQQTHPGSTKGYNLSRRINGGGDSPPTPPPPFLFSTHEFVRKNMYANVLDGMTLLLSMCVRVCAYRTYKYIRQHL